MKKILFSFFGGFIFVVGQAQLTPDGAYLIGDYVEIGINPNGHEGAPDLTGSHSRSSGTPEFMFGIVADPNATDWTEYNGDYFSPGTPENGFVVFHNDTYYSSNASSLASADTVITSGGITSYLETTDSIYVSWLGWADSVEVVVDYLLKKDEAKYSTKVTFTNLSTTDISGLFYGRNLDPDNNQSIGGSYTTNNCVRKQPTVLEPYAVVNAFQELPHFSEISFVSENDNMWRAYKGGFSNRKPNLIWTGFDATTSLTVGDTISHDEAIGLAYNLMSLNAGESHTISFQVQFTPVEIVGLAIDEPSENKLKVYPTITSQDLQIELEGAFTYFIITSNGEIVKEGVGRDQTQVNIQELPNGVYFMKIKSGNIYYSQKIVKQ